MTTLRFLFLAGQFDTHRGLKDDVTDSMLHENHVFQGGCRLGIAEFNGNQFNNDNVKMPLNVSENNVTFVLALAVTKLTTSNSKV